MITSRHDGWWEHGSTELSKQLAMIGFTDVAVVDLHSVVVAIVVLYHLYVKVVEGETD